MQFGSLDGEGQFVFVLPSVEEPLSKELEEAEAARIREAEEERRRAEAEAERKRQEEAEQRRREEEAKKQQAEAERKRKEEAARRAAEEAEKRRREAVEKQKKAQLKRVGLIPVEGSQIDSASGLPMEVICEKDGAPMVLVPSGEFLIGSADDDPDAYKHEKPQRRVHLEAFYIDEYPVTNEQYAKFIKATGHEKPRYWEDSKWNGPKQPVVGVTWYEAVAYCDWSGKRFPTEAEWEKGARGVDGRRYPWGNDWDGSKVIWDKTSGGKTHPVERDYNTHRSPYGAVDMAGNTWEWAADWYGKEYYRNAQDRNPEGPSSGGGRVLRGGSWYNGNTTFFRAANRTIGQPDDRNSGVSFRCAKASK